MTDLRPPSPQKLSATLLLAVCLLVGACSKKLKSGTAKLVPAPKEAANREANLAPVVRGWTGYLGPSRDGISPEPLPNADWGAKEPALLWKADIGKGAAGAVATVEGQIFVIGNENERDIVRCLDAASGDEQWATAYPCPLDDRQFEGGPAATPELAPSGAHLYVLSHRGELRCIATADGSELWRTDLVADHNGARPKWGYSGAPLLVGDKVIVDAGGSGGVVALDRLTGDPLWHVGEGKPGYAGPVRFPIENGTGVAVFSAAGLSGFAAKDGAPLFHHSWDTSYDVNAATPVYHAGHFFLCSGYGKGGGLISITGADAELVYETADAVSQFQTPVRIGEHLYLVSGDNSTRSRLVCLRFDNGELAWSEPIGGNRGNVIALAGGKLIVITERGEALLCEASPKGYSELGRFQASGGRVWAPPAYTDGHLIVRNNNGDLHVWDLR